MVKEVIGTDAAGRAYVSCCGAWAELAPGEVQRRAFLWLWRHNGKYHPRRRVPSPVPARAFGGLVNWF
jgi:hypothetical protein